MKSNISLRDTFLTETDLSRHEFDMAPERHVFADMSDEKLEQIIEMIKKLKVLYGADVYVFADMPEWVLRSWTDPVGHRAVPLRNGLWLDTKMAETDDDGNDVYIGYIVDISRTQAKGGSITVTLEKSPVVNKEALTKLKQYAALMNFVKLAVEREKKGERLEQYKEQLKMQIKQKKELMNNPMPQVPSPQGQQAQMGVGQAQPATPQQGQAPPMPGQM